MIIDGTGFTLSTLKEKLSVWQNRLRSVFGNDFVIKKEGVVDNIATASSLSSMDLENQIAFLIKQLNPMTAEGKWQDNLYRTIGLVREQATYTVVSRTCTGTPNTVIATGVLIIENASTKDQFRNNDPINFDANGKAFGSFTAEESGAIDLPSAAAINIVTPLPNLTGVFYESGNLVQIGQDYEDDDAFREHWQYTSATAGANTDDGLLKALLSLVESKSDLKIFSNRTAVEKDGLPPHTQRIVLNSAQDDETIANTIFKSIVDGNMVGLNGTIAVEVTDSEGEKETIKFDRASVKEIYIKVRISVYDNNIMAATQTATKNNIIKYITEHKFDMGSRIFSNMFAAAIYEDSNVSGITELKLSANGVDWTDYIQLSSTQVPSFDSTRIEVYEE